MAATSARTVRLAKRHIGRTQQVGCIRTRHIAAPRIISSKRRMTGQLGK